MHDDVRVKEKRSSVLKEPLQSIETSEQEKQEPMTGSMEVSQVASRFKGQ